MSAKLPKESDLLILEPALEQLPKVDALLFGVDGVLLDVSTSFPAVVCATVQRFLTDHCGWKPEGPPLVPEEALLLKETCGFGSDCDLTQAAILHLLSKAQRLQTTEVAVLQAASPTVQEFTEQLREKGGGLHAAEHLLMPTRSPEQRRELTLQWDQKLIVRLFREHYAGEEHCRELYGFEPEYVHGAGEVENEKVLLDADLLPAHIQRYGVLTGRTRQETELALERADMLGRVRQNNILCGPDTPQKPDPNALLDLVAAVGGRCALYVGDTQDDLRMVTEFRKVRSDRDPQVLSCMVLSGLAGKRERRLWLEHGVDLIAPDINAVLQLLATAPPNQKGTGR